MLEAPSERIGKVVAARWPYGPSSHHWTVSREQLARRESDLTEAEIRYVERTFNDYNGTEVFTVGFDVIAFSFMGFWVSWPALMVGIDQLGTNETFSAWAGAVLSAGIWTGVIVGGPRRFRRRRLLRDLSAALRSRPIKFTNREANLLKRAQRVCDKAGSTRSRLERLDSDLVGPPLDLHEEQRAIKRRIYAAARLRMTYADTEGNGKTLPTLGSVLAAAGDRIDAIEAYRQRLDQVVETLKEIDRLKFASDSSAELLDLVTESGLAELDGGDVARSTLELTARHEGLQYLVKMLDQDVERLRAIDGGRHVTQDVNR
jgi:hypothetical protein